MRFFADNPRPQFRVGEQVRISEGPFAPFSGVIEEIDDEHSRMKVAISIFGRPTTVEIEFSKVDKL
jgi:transcriptional antiterminator NusG